MLRARGVEICHVVFEFASMCLALETPSSRRDDLAVDTWSVSVPLGDPKHLGRGFIPTG